MKQLKKIYKSWRCLVVITLAVVTFLLAIADSDSAVVCILSKVAAFVVGFATAGLAMAWASAGKLNEIMGIDE